MSLYQRNFNRHLTISMFLFAGRQNIGNVFKENNPQTNKEEQV